MDLGPQRPRAHLPLGRRRPHRHDVVRVHLVQRHARRRQEGRRLRLDARAREAQGGHVAHHREGPDAADARGADGVVAHGRAHRGPRGGTEHVERHPRRRQVRRHHFQAIQEEGTVPRRQGQVGRARRGSVVSRRDRVVVVRRRREGVDHPQRHGPRRGQAPREEQRPVVRGARVAQHPVDDALRRTGSRRCQQFGHGRCRASNVANDASTADEVVPEAASTVDAVVNEAASTAGEAVADDASSGACRGASHAAGLTSALPPSFARGSGTPGVSSRVRVRSKSKAPPTTPSGACGTSSGTTASFVFPPFRRFLAADMLLRFVAFFFRVPDAFLPASPPELRAASAPLATATRRGAADDEAARRREAEIAGASGRRDGLRPTLATRHPWRSGGTQSWRRARTAVKEQSIKIKLK